MNPAAFVSYARETGGHKDWVRTLASDLRGRGVDVSLDQWDAPPGSDLVQFMERGVVDSDRVIVVCSDEYADRADERRGSVGYEAMIVSAELFAKLDTTKFIPVIRANRGEPPRLPRALAGRRYVDFRDDAKYGEALDELTRALHDTPAFTKPPLGENLFGVSASPPSTEVPGAATARRPLEDRWFHSERALAQKAVGEAGLASAATMEVQMGLSASLSRIRAPQLLEAARAATIRTFGWPIGVVLDNRDDARPQPTAEGIRAMVQHKFGKAYDYWALRGNGDFYLLHTLFEDERDPQAIFFNTRIVRAAETLMYGSRLYTHLGAPEGTEAHVRLTHAAFANRTLKSAGGTRHLFPRTTTVDRSSETVRFVLPLNESGLAQHVKELLAPMFELFDYMEFAESVYEDIVHRFVQGEVT